ncbi:MFS transporter [Streptomyces sp. NBC_00624]
MFGNPLSGWIMDRFHGVNGWQGWQWMFVLEAIPALVIGVATLFYLDDGVRSAKWLNDEEKAVVERAIAEDVAHRTVHGRVGDAFRDPKVWLMCLIYFCFVMGPLRPDFLGSRGPARTSAASSSVLPELSASLEQGRAHALRMGSFRRLAAARTTVTSVAARRAAP